jgi:hypothetical protein
MRMLIALLVLLTLTGSAASADMSPKIVADVYPYICSGALRNAVLAELKDGRIAECGGIVLGQRDIDQQVLSMRESLREQARKYPVYALEQCVTQKLIALEATEWAKAGGSAATTDSGLVDAYLKSQLPKLSATDQEVEDFYKEHSKLFGGYPLADVKSAVVGTLLDEKKSAAIDAFKAAVSNRHSVQVSSTWFALKREKWASNPVEQARVSGKPSLVSFGVIGCCDTMHPVVEQFRVSHGSDINVVFIHVGEQTALSDLYGVSAIPVQMLFDKDGKERYRHQGYISEDQILAKFAECGIYPDKGTGI